MSNILPCRTLATPVTPSERSAPSIALPCGSRMPVFSVTVTRAFIERAYRMSRRLEPGELRPFTAKLETPKAGLQVIYTANRRNRACLALHQHRAGAARRLAFVHDAEAL